MFTVQETCERAVNVSRICLNCSMVFCGALVFVLSEADDRRRVEKRGWVKSVQLARWKYQ